MFGPLRNPFAGWRYRLIPKLAKLAVYLTTRRAQRILRASGPITLLVDNPVLYHAVTHETMWVQERTCGYLARVPVHRRKEASREFNDVCYLGGIAYLARLGLVRLVTSAELQDERLRQPVGRYRGYSWFDFSLFKGIEMESIDGFVFPTLGPSWLNLPSSDDQQRSRIDGKGDELYQSMVAKLGKKHSQDAWHIRTAEAHGVYGFLTMDYTLRRHVGGRLEREPFRSLRTRVLSPSEFGREFGIRPLHPRIFSYDDREALIRADLSRPDGKRQPLAAYGAPKRYGVTKSGDFR